MFEYCKKHSIEIYDYSWEDYIDEILFKYDFGTKYQRMSELDEKTQFFVLQSDLSNVEYSVDHKTATLSLGGIYSFNYISFSGRGKGKYEISIFNGSRYESLTSGDLMRGKTCVKLENPIEDSYQIQVYCETGFSSSNEFEIKIKDEP